MCLVITGNPGVGKHTVAKYLAKKLQYKILDINEFVIKSKLYKKNNDTLDVKISKLKNEIKKKIMNKSIVVGHLAPYVVPKAQVKAVFILRKNPYKLISVYKKRKYPYEKMIENLGSEILGIIAFDALKKFGKTKCHQIDSTSRSASKIVRIMESIIRNSQNGDDVDWLSLIAQKGDLQKFFSY
jgi:adenylate kinase